MERQITIIDSRDETLSALKYDLIGHMIAHISENPEDTLDDWTEALDYDGTLNEMVDSSVPIYYHEIDSWYFLYPSELEEAYNNAGCYTEPPDNYKQVAIYFWLEQEAQSWMQDELKDWFEEKLEPLQEYATKRGIADKEIWSKMVAKLDYSDLCD